MRSKLELSSTLKEDLDPEAIGFRLEIGDSYCSFEEVAEAGVEVLKPLSFVKGPCSMIGASIGAPNESVLKWRPEIVMVPVVSTLLEAPRLASAV